MSRNIVVTFMCTSVQVYSTVKYIYYISLRIYPADLARILSGVADRLLLIALRANSTGGPEIVARSITTSARLRSGENGEAGAVKRIGTGFVRLLMIGI